MVKKAEDEHFEQVRETHKDFLIDDGPYFGDASLGDMPNGGDKEYLKLNSGDNEDDDDEDFDI